MKVIAAFIALLSVASAFAPQSSGRASTKLNEKLMDKVFGMDLFAPVKEQNDYGARNKMNKLKQGRVGPGSYVPAGLSLAEYQKIRDADAKKAAANYDKNVKKAFKYVGFDEFYLKRGTDLNQAWAKDKGKGHNYVKTKYDYSGAKDETKGWGDAIGSIFSGKK